MKITDNPKLKTIVFILNDEEIQNLQRGGYPVFDISRLPFMSDKNHKYITLMRDNSKSGSSNENPNTKSNEGNE